jgi:uroporphyrinogen decarboxylase
VVPSIDQHVLQDDKGKLARLEIPDPKRDGRLPAFLEQCEALSAAKLPSALGSVNVGPWTIAMLMRNPELMCLDTIDDPEFVHELMRFATEYAKRVGDAVLETKIGLSYSDPTASCSLVGPETYREFIKPYHKDLVDYFKAKKVGTTVHICGTTHQIHEDLMDVGFVAVTIDLDQQGDPALKVDQLDRLVTLGNQRGVVGIGNVDVTIFERATQAEIEAEVRRCIDTVGPRSRFVLSTSCELPPQANPDCVRWFMEAAREYGRYERILTG